LDQIPSRRDHQHIWSHLKVTETTNIKQLSSKSTHNVQSNMNAHAKWPQQQGYQDIHFQF